MANTAAGGSRSRPDLVLQGFPNMGTDTTVDLTITTVVAGLNAGESTTRTDAAAKTTAHSADQAEAAKQSSYARRHPAHFGAAFRGLAYEHHGCPGKDMDRFLRLVATYHVLGHGTIGADKDREQKIQYNRFITASSLSGDSGWAPHYSGPSHSGSSRSHAATTRPADTRTTIARLAWEISFTLIIGVPAVRPSGRGRAPSPDVLSHH
jgi:hypothetical protein